MSKRKGTCRGKGQGQGLGKGQGKCNRRSGGKGTHTYTYTCTIHMHNTCTIHTCTTYTYTCTHIEWITIPVIKAARVKPPASLFYSWKEASLDAKKVHVSVGEIAKDFLGVVTGDGVYSTQGKRDPRHRLDLMELSKKRREVGAFYIVVDL